MLSALRLQSRHCVSLLMQRIGFQPKMGNFQMKKEKLALHVNMCLCVCVCPVPKPSVAIFREFGAKENSF